MGKAAPNFHATLRCHPYSAAPPLGRVATEECRLGTKEVSARRECRHSLRAAQRRYSVGAQRTYSLRGCTKEIFPDLTMAEWHERGHSAGTKECRDKRMSGTGTASCGDCALFHATQPLSSREISPLACHCSPCQSGVYLIRGWLVNQVHGR